MLGQVIDLLVVLLAAALAVLAYKLGTRRSADVRSCDVLADKLKANTMEDSKTRQNAIVGALSDDDPAGGLADLGNERRS